MQVKFDGLSSEIGQWAFDETTAGLRIDVLFKPVHGKKPLQSSPKKREDWKQLEFSFFKAFPAFPNALRNEIGICSPLDLLLFHIGGTPHDQHKHYKYFYYKLQITITDLFIDLAKLL